MEVSQTEKPTHLEYKSYCGYCGAFVESRIVLPDLYPENGRMNDSVCLTCREKMFNSIKK